MSRARRIAVLSFSVVSYAVFFGTFLYLIGFVTDLWVPRSVSRGGQALPLGWAVVVDLGLVALFGAQHSVMARAGFKSWMGRHLEPAAGRSLFVLAASGVLILMFATWQPLSAPLWDLGGTVGGRLLFMGQLAGWLMVLVSTFLIDHFELFGLRQAYAFLRGREFTPPAMKTPGLYRFVRHPIYLGLLIAFWSAPTMTLGRLVFALGMSGYILVGIRFEERDLIAHFGETYRAYRARVGMLLPRPMRPKSEQVPGLQRREE
ncbi:MAG: methanethiol S-methyltransferase [Myxococcota bacterium]